MMAKYVVIGANSFSGQDFVDLLLDDSARQVTGISRSPERSRLFLRYKSRSELSNYRYIQLDLNKQMEQLLDLLDEERAEYVINFAAQSEVAPSWEHPEHWFQTNCVALARLVNHLRKRDYLKRYLHVSSPEAYGTSLGVVQEDAPLNPSTPYAVSKAAADFFLRTMHRQFGFPVVTVRATNVYGPCQQPHKIIPRSVIYLKLGRKIELHGGGAAVKSYIHIRDVSLGELAVLERGQQGQIYHLSPDRGVSVRHVVWMLATKMGHRFEDVTMAVAERPGQDAAYVIDSSKTRRELAWSPTVPLEKGLPEVIAWVQQYWDDIKQQPLEYQHKP